MKRASNSRRGDRDRDRISNLPDCLIHLIMSFLTAQAAVRTCILSKRWKNLWTTLPFLDFDLQKFEYDEESEDGAPKRNKFDMFVNFVSTTLVLREASDLHKFHLSCDGVHLDHLQLQQYRMFIRSWILYAHKHNLQEFATEFPLEDSKVPLGGVFTCASLVDASLYDVTAYLSKSLHQVKVVNLPCLKQLFLRGIELNQDFVDKLFSGCPVLEFLHLEDCCTGFSTIISQSLKYLKVHFNESLYVSYKKTELINAPNLLSFCYEFCPEVIGDIMLLKMPSLTNANIVSDDMRYKGNGILIGLSNVQNLVLRGKGIKELLENGLPNCTEFSNLKDLSVENFCLLHYFNLLASFLNHSPNLEKLSLRYSGCHCSSQERVHGNEGSLKIAPFKGKQLKIVKVKFFKSRSFPQFVKYLQDLTWNSGAQINMTT